MKNQPNEDVPSEGGSASLPMLIRTRPARITLQIGIEAALVSADPAVRAYAERQKRLLAALHDTPPPRDTEYGMSGCTDSVAAYSATQSSMWRVGGQ